MFNKEFKRDWKEYDGEIGVFESKHFQFSIDKDFIGISLIYIHRRPRIFYLKLFCLCIRFY